MVQLYRMWRIYVGENGLVNSENVYGSYWVIIVDNCIFFSQLLRDNFPSIIRLLATRIRQTPAISKKCIITGCNITRMLISVCPKPSSNEGHIRYVGQPTHIHELSIYILTFSKLAQHLLKYAAIRLLALCWDKFAFQVIFVKTRA